jgi:xanthoxin dehydrogenase
MQPQGSGSIISLASTAGVQGGLGPHVYAAAKHAVVGLTKNVAAELCRSGVRANCLAPGSTATPLVAQAHLDDHHALDAVAIALAEDSPILGRPGMPIDVANGALYLACEESGNTNGHCLVIDAGIVTGSTATDPPFSEPMAMMREAGRTGL